MICRYLVFAYLAYEITGMNDCIDQTWFFKKALDIIKKHRERKGYYVDYYVIWDLLKNKEVHYEDYIIKKNNKKELTEDEKYERYFGNIYNRKKIYNEKK